ncbi:MAG: hypothetical protein WD491_13845 [Balneolales bacterium]
MMKNENQNPALVLGEIGLVHSLGMAGVPVYVGSNERNRPVMYSRYAQKKYYFSDYSSEKFVDELENIGRSHDRKITIFSDNDDALLTISNHRDRLAKSFYFIFPEADLVEKVLDKQQFGRLAEENNLPVPVTFGVSSSEQMQETIRQLRFPVILKPMFRSDWYHKDFSRIVGLYKKAYKCDNKNEVFTLYNKISQINPRLVVQEFVRGDDDMHYELNMYVSEKSEVKGYFIGRKHRVCPIGAGMGSYIETVEDKEVLDKSLKMVETLRLKGLLDFQYKRDNITGDAKLLEIHFRNTVWGNLGAIAGLNLYKLYHNELTGNVEPYSQTYRLGVKYFALVRDIPAFRQYHAAGQLTFREWLRTYRGDYVIEECRIKDIPALFANIWLMLKSWWRNKTPKETIPAKITAKSKVKGAV